MRATVVSLLAHVPALEVLDNVALPVPQKAEVPVMVAGAAFIVTVAVEAQLEIA